MTEFQNQRAMGGRASGVSDLVLMDEFSFLWHFWTDAGKGQTLLQQGKNAPQVLFSMAADAVINNDFGAARMQVTIGHWLAEFVRHGKKLFKETFIKTSIGNATPREPKKDKNPGSFAEMELTRTDPGLVYFLADHCLTCTCLKKFADHIRSLEQKHGKIQKCNRCDDHKPESIGSVCEKCNDHILAWYCSSACLELDKKRHAPFCGLKGMDNPDLCTDHVPNAPKTSFDKLFESQGDVTADFLHRWMKTKKDNGDRSVVIPAEEYAVQFFKLLYGSGMGAANDPEALNLVGEFNLAQRRILSGGGVGGRDGKITVPRLTSWQDVKQYLIDSGTTGVKRKPPGPKETHLKLAISATSDFFVSKRERPHQTAEETKRIKKRWSALVSSFDAVKQELREKCEENAKRPCKLGTSKARKESDEAWISVDRQKKQMRPAELMELLSVLLVWEQAMRAGTLWLTKEFPWGQWMDIYIRRQEVVMDAFGGGVSAVQKIDEKCLLFGKKEKLLLQHIAKVVPVAHTLCAFESFFPVLFWDEVLQRAAGSFAACPASGEKSCGEKSPKIWSPARLPWKQNTILTGQDDHGDGGKCFSSTKSVYVFTDKQAFANQLGATIVKSLGGDLTNSVLGPVFNGPTDSFATEPELSPLTPYLAPKRKFDRTKFEEIFAPIAESNTIEGYAYDQSEDRFACIAWSVGFDSPKIFQDYGFREMNNFYNCVCVQLPVLDSPSMEMESEKWTQTEEMIGKVMGVVEALGEELEVDVTATMWTHYAQ